MWNNLYSKRITTYTEANDQAKLDMKTEDVEEEKRRMEMQTGGPVRRGDLTRRRDNFGYSSRMNTDDRLHYNRGLFNYRQPERPDRDWEGNHERREISLIERGREGGNNYGRNQ